LFKRSSAAPGSAFGERSPARFALASARILQGKIPLGLGLQTKQIARSISVFFFVFRHALIISQGINRRVLNTLQDT